MAKSDKSGRVALFCAALVKAAIIVAVVSMAASVSSLLSSCSRKVVQVPVEVRHEAVRSDSVRLVDLRRDSVIVADTVRVVLSEAGDTVRLYQVKWRERVSVKRDTAVIVRSDTVRVDTPVLVEVPATEKKPSKWPVILLCIAIAAACVMAIRIGSK